MAGFEYDERVLEDDNPVFYGYWYLADGEPLQSPVAGTVRDLRKKYPEVKVWQYADLTKRNLKPFGWE